MSMYRIVWEQELDADSAEEAARLCRASMLDPESIATCYTCTNLEQDGAKEEFIDLDEIDAEREGAQS